MVRRDRRINCAHCCARALAVLQVCEWLAALADAHPVPQPVQPQTVQELVERAAESIEAASNKRAVSDRFQCLYHLQCAYNALVRLEYVARGGRHFMYLPKHAFEAFPADVRRTFEDVLEPRGRLDGVHALLLRYIDQFERTARALCAGDVPHIAAALRLAVQRDQFYNFRAVATACPRPVLFRSGRPQCLSDLVRLHGVRSVLDLRTDAEAEAKAYDVPDGVRRAHVNVCPDAGAGAGAGGQYGYFAAEGRPRLGMALRAVAALPQPLLLHCHAGRDRTGVVAAVLVLVAGGDEETVVRDYLASHQGVRAADIRGFLRLVASAGGAPPGAAVYRFVRACGLEHHEYVGLTRWLGGSEEALRRLELDRGRLRFQYHEGRPGVACRPFLPEEKRQLLRNMLSGKPRARQPIALFVTGLPGAGKTTSLRRFWTDAQEWLGAGGEAGDRSLESLVDLDMDSVRQCHAQFALLSHGLAPGGAAPAVPGPTAAHATAPLWSYTELVGWFLDGVDAEGLLYRDPDGVVHRLWEGRHSFVLPAVLNRPECLQFVRDCKGRGYQPHLVCVRAALDVALRRARARAAQTGRWTPDEVVRGGRAGLADTCAAIAAFVKECSGTVTLYDNNEDGRPPRRVFHSGAGDPALSASFVAELRTLSGFEGDP